MSKVLFFDVDGTLVDHASETKEIPETVKNEMRRLQKLGYKLIIASGRPFAFISDNISSFNFDGYVLCNGAHVELDGKILSNHPLDVEKTKYLIEELDKDNCEYIVQTTRDCYLKPEFKVLNDFFERCVINHKYLKHDFVLDKVLPNVLKLEIGQPSVEKAKHIEKIIGNNFNFDSHGTENSFEVYSKNVTKAVGVNIVLEYLNLPKEASYAFGDGLNDIEMIQAVGTGVAMGNAADELKEVADIVCGAIYDDGLTKILKDLF